MPNCNYCNKIVVEKCIVILINDSYWANGVNVVLISSQKADLTSIMDSAGPLTVFAPVSAAFNKMKDGHFQYLSSTEVNICHR